MKIKHIFLSVLIASMKTEDVVSVGDVVTAKCIGIDDKGRVKMSIRAALRDAKAAEAEAAGITE